MIVVEEEGIYHDRTTSSVHNIDLGTFRLLHITDMQQAGVSCLKKPTTFMNQAPKFPYNSGTRHWYTLTYIHWPFLHISTYRKPQRTFPSWVTDDSSGDRPDRGDTIPEDAFTRPPRGHNRQSDRPRSTPRKCKRSSDTIPAAEKEWRWGERRRALFSAVLFGLLPIFSVLDGTDTKVTQVLEIVCT